MLMREACQRAGASRHARVWLVTRGARSSWRGTAGDDLRAMRTSSFLALGGACLLLAAQPSSTVDRDVARVRTATSSFRALDSAVAAGYARDVPRCLEHLPHGAMGYHHVNRALLDDKVEVERPEILLYSKTPDGYRLNGVEYIVPYRIRPRDAEPPTVMGQQLKRSDELQLWYLHVWTWEKNPNGLFADWNPSVKCS
jgi:hypothetical protein